MMYAFLMLGMTLLGGLVRLMQALRRWSFSSSVFAIAKA